MGFARPGGRLKALLTMMAFLAMLAPAMATAAPRADNGRDGRIVGGTPVPNGKYPFMVKLQIGIGRYIYNCGGSLIDESHVLTAAHCLFDEDFVRAKAEDISARVGVTDLRNPSQGELRRVESFAIFRTYKPNRSGNGDVAVLELRDPVMGIEPVELPAGGDSRFEVVGANYTVAGWGRTKEGGSSPPRMREAKVELWSNARCEKKLGYDGALEICAAAPGRDSCQGDSGGPLFREFGDRRVQIGIVSWGVGCARPGEPGAYSRLTNKEIAAFIEKQTAS